MYKIPTSTHRENLEWSSDLFLKKGRSIVNTECYSTKHIDKSDKQDGI